MENVGGKIKGLAKFITILGLIACVILFFVGQAAYNEDKDYIEYATVNGGAYGYPRLQQAGDNAYNGLQLRNLALTLAGSLAVAFFPLYGFGVLIEHTEQQTIQLRELQRQQQTTNQLLTALCTQLKKDSST